ncbi:hypothetical protein BDV96DRAFT_583927 [Lophiotrema nucula]|uniref:Uncharacterized protein n=1 Tax=Lophiotrema nucula TaxID=690887 RepID=A0A6A5YV21_9PLEO|nr:hypothetical protein BDV96DRAFT_583927 [Lophiotrema nucula]
MTRIEEDDMTVLQSIVCTAASLGFLFFFSVQTFGLILSVLASVAAPIILVRVNCALLQADRTAGSNARQRCVLAADYNSRRHEVDLTRQIGECYSYAHSRRYGIVISHGSNGLLLFHIMLLQLWDVKVVNKTKTL